jgi:hypothetical protein
VKHTCDLLSMGSAAVGDVLLDSRLLQSLAIPC